MTAPKAALTNDVEALLAEVDAAFEHNRWAMLVRRSTKAGEPLFTEDANVRLYAGGGLRHCCALLAEIDHARTEQRDLGARLAGRAHLEAWLTATYIHLGGFEALSAVDAGSRAGVLAWEEVIRAYNLRLNRDIKRAEFENRRIAKSNEHRRRSNLAHPEREPVPLLPDRPLPTRATNDLDVSPLLRGGTGAPPTRLPLSEIVQRLNRLFRKAGASDPALELAYDYAYRGLSTFGVHPTTFMFASYQVERDRRFVRLGPSSQLSSMAEGITHVAVVLTAELARLILGSEGHDLQVADRLVEKTE